VQLPDWRDAAGERHPGIALSVHEAGTAPASRPPLVLCHGFPELAYSWRHQIPALAAAGFRAIAPDQRGYGSSDRPPRVEDYGLEPLCADLAGLLDALEIERAIFVGHDWGGFVAWAMPLLHPARCAGVIGVNTPYMRFPTTAALRRAFADDERLYILWFQKPGVAEAVLDKNPRLVFERIMRRASRGRGGMWNGELADANPFRRAHEIPPPENPLLSEQDLDYYTSAYARSGFAGPIHWYRNIDANAERLPDLGRRPLSLPCLMITAEWDAALPPSLAADMGQYCSDLETHMIARCGHWTQQEQPAELNRLLLDWLTRRFPRA
jgi:pimeloyl-ACP methyl ester carboxylesterase